MSDSFVSVSPVPPSAVLVATLGGQPQVITLALDALLDRGYPIKELIVVHLSEQNPRYEAALARLSNVFVNGRYREHTLRYRPYPVLLGNTPIRDIQAEAATDAVLNTFHQLLQQLKRQGLSVHLCISGGRRMLGLLGLAAALIHFDYADRIWHLYSTDDVRAQTHEGAMLHVPPNTPGVQLLPVPVRPWGYLFTALQTPAHADAQTVLAAQQSQINTDEHARCQSVYDRLTPRPRDVLRAFAQGLNPQEVANKLAIELSTVRTYQTTIYQECQAVWNLPATTRMDYHWVRDAFRQFFA